MKEALCISITFLDNMFHGQGDYEPEWPPSPFRLYQALLAGMARTRCDEDEALQWFEQLPAPEILAPFSKKATSRTIYVPNNDSDKQLDRQQRLAPKHVRPTHILNGLPLHYLWEISPEDKNLANRIAEHARTISTLGWGIDLVVGNGLTLSLADVSTIKKGYHGNQWRPTKGASVVLRCPKQGSLHDLSSTFKSSLDRFEGNAYTPARRAREFREVAYARTGIVIRPTAAFNLLKAEGDTERWSPFDQRHTAHVAAMVRGIACKLAKSSTFDFPGGSETYVAGHTGAIAKTPPRFSYLPLPTLGHPQADGVIRRLLVAEPVGGNGIYSQWALDTLHLQAMIDVSRNPRAILNATTPDNVFNCYIRTGKTFHSVTPVILPGYDDKKYSKVEKLLIKAIEQASYSIKELDDLYVQKAPFFKGAFHPSTYARPKYLKHLSAIHVKLTWKIEIPGPLTIGAGRHCGLGLFAAVESS
jgi:CRISPR-associated protein Csb2